MILNIDYMIYNPFIVKDEIFIDWVEDYRVYYYVSGCYRTSEENIIIYDLIPLDEYNEISLNPISMIFNYKTGEFYLLNDDSEGDIEIPVKSIVLVRRYYKNTFECDYICKFKNTDLCNSCPINKLLSNNVIEDNIYYVGDKIRLMTEDGKYSYKTDVLGIDNDEDKFKCIYSLNSKDVVQKLISRLGEYYHRNSKYRGISESGYRYNYRYNNEVDLYYRGGFTLNTNPCDRCIFSNCKDCQVERLGLKNVFKTLIL